MDTFRELVEKEETAEEVYTRLSKEIDKNLKALTTKVTKHKKDFAKSDKKNWGYVGDFGLIAEKLQELL